VSGKRWFVVIGALAALASVQAIDAFARRHLVLINRSPSLPNWAYFVERGATPVIGDVAFFVPPKNALVAKHFGSAPAAFGKVVYAAGGDVIEHRGDQVLVHRTTDGVGRPAQLVSVRKPYSARGEVLEAGPSGRVPDGCYYMGSPHKDGFDSRYAAIGFVCDRQIVGVARRVIL